MRNMTSVALAGILMAGTGCTGKGTGSGAALSVSARTVTGAAGSTSAPPSGSLDLGDGIAVSRVRLALREIGLEAAASAGGSAGSSTEVEASSRRSGGEDRAGESGGSGGGSGGGGDGSGGEAGDDPGEVKVGPFLVDLEGGALSGGALAQVFDADVPAGTYRELRIVVAPVEPAGATRDLADLNGSSVVIDGTIDGAPFTFVSRLTSAQKRESTLTVSAAGASNNVTLTIAPAGWFKAQDGARLDPTVDGNRSAIEGNLRASIDAFADDDGDGHEDGPGHR